MNAHARPLPTVGDDAMATLSALGVDLAALAGAEVPARSPINGETIATLRATTPAEVDAAVARAHAAFLYWRKVPAPRRCELVRLFGEELRAAKDHLGRLVALEAGKVTS